MQRQIYKFRARAAPVIETFSAWLRAAEANTLARPFFPPPGMGGPVPGPRPAHRAETHRHHIGEGAAYYSDMASELADIRTGLEDDDEPTGQLLRHRDAVEAMEEDVEPLLAAGGLPRSTCCERLSARLLVTRWQFLRDLAERDAVGALGSDH